MHKGFAVLDTMPHVLTGGLVSDAADIFVVLPSMIPNPNWIRPGAPSAGQQKFGAKLLADHKFILIPSAVSTHSWNLVFEASRAAGAYKMTRQEVFALDTRLHPPA